MAYVQQEVTNCTFNWHEMIDLHFYAIFYVFLDFFSFTLLNYSSGETVTIFLSNHIQHHVKLTSWKGIHDFKRHCWNLVFPWPVSLKLVMEVPINGSWQWSQLFLTAHGNWVSLLMGTDNDPSLLNCFCCLLHLIFTFFLLYLPSKFFLPNPLSKFHLLNTTPLNYTL